MLEEERQTMSDKDATTYRAIAARANYLALDRPDIQYPTKEVCREMSDPSVGGKRKLKRLGRHLIERPGVVLKYQYQEREDEVTGYSDSDWAVCQKTAKSTSGGVLTIGTHTIKSWSSTQKSITLSSGEAELAAAVKTCTGTIGLTQLAHDCGVTLEGRIYVDSAAAVGISNGQGNGRMRHVKVGDLWIQERIEEGELRVDKVRGEENPADLRTKYLSAAKIQSHMTRLEQEFRDGRADNSLRI